MSYSEVQYLDKETNRMVRFTSGKRPEMVGKTYLNKGIWEELGKPHTITVTLAPAGKEDEGE